ncbi:amidohydrolase family protein [Winogradskya humida]|uniref:Amidohydrolase-related domain-containing protein n=1 Tax=Winogradskya humida TaxID=113566 RepID=A0ABQ3ZTL5_9ACTN|nr:amidohydrolase family protein [Actinoplanes humidus]GIE21919.1 hypothetical protein Ahu01nite_050210 [Actinoplanes humidus]
MNLPGTVLPGLIDAHAHAQLLHLPTLRAGGISGVWDLGGNPSAVTPFLIERFAGPFLTAPGGYPTDRSWVPPDSCREIRSPADAADAVAEAHAFGATLIKVTAHAGGPMLPASTLSALVTAAHSRELPVVVHAEGPGTVEAALEAGADMLAHTPWTELLDAGLVRDCAARMTWISTIDIHGWGTSTPARETAIANLRQFVSYAGKVRYGTDLGNGPLPLGVNAREIRALQLAGLSPSDILTAMTGSDSDFTAATGFGGDLSAVTGCGAVESCWVPGGLDLSAGGFADSLATARVLGPEVQPRQF